MAPLHIIGAPKLRLLGRRPRHHRPPPPRSGSQRTRAAPARRQPLPVLLVRPPHGRAKQQAPGARRPPRLRLPLLGLLGGSGGAGGSSPARSYAILGVRDDEVLSCLASARRPRQGVTPNSKSPPNKATRGCLSPWPSATHTPWPAAYFLVITTDLSKAPGTMVALRGTSTSVRPLHP